MIALSGPLGVGKTALARGILAALGHEGEVPSPSFAIVQPYEELDPPVWHVDLYRIEDPSEMDELGLDSAGRRRAARRMARARRRKRVARCARPVARLRGGGRAALDSAGPPGMGGAMASAMTPAGACS